MVATLAIAPEAEKVETEVAQQAGDLEARAASLAIADTAGYQAAASFLADIADAENSVEAKRVELVKPLNDHVKKINDMFRPLARRLEAVRNTVSGKVLAWRQAEQRRVEEERARAEAARRKAEAEEAERRAAAERARREEEEARHRAEAMAREEEAARQRAREAQGAAARKRAEQEAAEAESRKRAADLMARNKAAAEAKARADADAAREAQARAETERARALRSAPTTTVAGSTGGSLTAKKRWTFKVVDPVQVPRAYLEVNEKAIRAAVKAGVRQIPGVEVFQVEDLAVTS